MSALLGLVAMVDGGSAADFPIRIAIPEDAIASGGLVEIDLAASTPVERDKQPDVVERGPGIDATPVVADVVPGRRPTLLLKLGPRANGGGRSVEWRGWKTNPVAVADGGLRVVERAEAVDLVADGKPILRFRHAVDPAPAGSNPLFNRSGFIHPLWSPAGAELTGTRPADHLHHMGIWNAWTKTDWKGQEVDFWNIGRGLGTVRFHEFRWKSSGPLACGFGARQHHVALKAGPAETVVLDEDLDVRAVALAEGFLVDYEMAQTNVTEHVLELPAYRYGGGIAFRGPAEWRRETSDYLTSERKTRRDGHTSRARWCAMAGTTRSGPAGVAILSHPENHDAPQRLRVWGDDAEGRIFFNYVPVQESAWKIDPRQTIVLRYRIFVFDGPPDVGRIERHWSAYARKRPVAGHAP